MTPQATKDFDPLAIAGLSCGVMLAGSFSDIHEAAEWVAGHPIWTHELADKAVWARLQALVTEQFPDMPTEAPGDAWETLRDDIRARYGDTIQVQRGTDQRTADPITTAIKAVSQ